MINNKLRNFVGLVVPLFMAVVPVHAQQQESYYDPENGYRLGTELFARGKYSAAREEFQKYLHDDRSGNVNNHMNAEYYSALSGAELFHPDAEAELVAFTQKYPESIKAKQAYFHAGRILYKQKKYKGAVTNFEKADLAYLTNDEIPEYYFKLGYSYFMLKNYPDASKSFHNILKVDSKYQTAAMFYYAHVAYESNNLNTALEYFEKLKDSESFGPIVPYYIIQIYYEQGKYDEVIAYAKTLEGKSDYKNPAEISRYVGESYYKKGKYAEALVLFEDFGKNYPRLSREDYYELGYCYYKVNRYDDATRSFEKVVGPKDALSQSAYFNLGDCFLKRDNKQSARNAFQFAARESFDKGLREEAQFLYAKLSYELNFQPVAINAFNEFLKEYPASVHTDEANELLAQLYITTRNYKDALAALDKIRARSPRAEAAYQKVAYYRGIEYFNDRDYVKAIALFTKAITTDADQLIRAQAMYWKAEAFYNQQQYDAAVKQYRIFLFNPPSVNTKMYHTTNYNLGYSHFKLANYAEANTWFRKYIHEKDETDPARYNDALIRVGDGFFMLKDYDNASRYYSDAITAQAKASDYCLFQDGVIQGIRGDMTGKSATMTRLSTSYPRSPYLDDAAYEKGTAQMALEQYGEAEQTFRKVIADFPEGEYAKKSLLRVALVQYNRKQDQDALTTFKTVVTKYPATPEAAEALNGIKNIYVASGNPQEYFDYMKTAAAMTISKGAQDSITYEAAETLYMKGDYSKAGPGFGTYLSSFPNGYYAQNATFYKAECDYKNKDLTAALAGYRAIVDQPRNLFTEKSLLRAGTIEYSDTAYREALGHFDRLEEIADFRDNVIEAQAGQMRCHYFLQQYDDCIVQARKLTEGDKVPIELVNEAWLLTGRSSLALNDLQKATQAFTLAAKVPNSAGGAESKYSLALIQYRLGNFKESQKKCFEVINQVPSYEYWIGKSFLLLGDNYAALRDTFQAKHTYQSLIDNYERNPGDPDDLRDIATERLNAIVKSENELMQKEIEEKEKKYFENEADTTGGGHE